MSEKEYPMPESYHKFLAETMKMIEIRDDFAARLKFAAPDERQKLREEIARTDKLIDRAEASLARQYETHQRECRKDEEWEEKMRKAERFYIYVMYRRPDMFAEVATNILRYVYNVAKDGDGFHKRIKHLIATELDEILDDKNLDQFDF